MLMTADQFPDASPAKLPDGTFEADSLLTLVALALRYRLVLLVVGGLGAVFGSWQGYHQQRYRTIAVCRLQAEGISHAARTWWEVESKTVCAELRSLYAANHPGEVLTARVEPEPWLLRLDLNHDRDGQGQQLLQAVLDQLNLSRQRIQVRENVQSVRGGRLRVALLHLSETLTSVLPADSDPLDTKAATSDSGDLRTLMMDREWRLPIEVTPYAAWYRQLSERASVGLQRLATSADADRAAAIERLSTSLENAGLEFHAYWASLDLLASTRVLPVVQNTSFSQQPRPRLTSVLLAAGFWSWICGGVAFAAVSVFSWFRRHRRMLTDLVAKLD